MDQQEVDLRSEEKLNGSFVNHEGLRYHRSTSCNVSGVCLILEHSLPALIQPDPVFRHLQAPEGRSVSWDQTLTRIRVLNAIKQLEVMPSLHLYTKLIWCNSGLLRTLSDNHLPGDR